MTRTRTLVIIGCFMLVLAVLAALELRSGESVLAEGQTVTGTLSKESPPETTPAPSLSSPSQPAGSQPGDTSASSVAAASPATLPAASLAPSDQPGLAGGSLRPLDNGTLRADNTSQPVPAKPEPVKPESVKTETVKPEPTKPEQAKPEQAKPEAVKPEPAKPAQPATEAPKPEPKTETKAAPADKNTNRVITTRAPEKLLPGESAIIWTHLELDGKQVIFRFTGAGPLDGKGFVLPDPPRYVVDLQGSWGIQLPKTPANDLVKSIRAGRQEANTRLVFDLARTLTSGQVQKVNKETLEIRLR